MGNKDKKTENDKNWWQNLELVTKFGVVVTAAVFIAIGIYAYICPGAFKNIIGDANEMGDFLAGTAGTLALVWLIVGYFLQSKELAQNTKALQGQKEEFSKQVDELSKQVGATNKMAEAMMSMAKSNEKLVEFYESESIKEAQEKMESVRPAFIRGGGGATSKSGKTLRVKNVGYCVNKLKIEVENDKVSYKENGYKVFKKDDEFALTYKAAKTHGWPLGFAIRYNDIHGNEFIERHEFDKDFTLSQVGDREYIGNITNNFYREIYLKKFCKGIFGIDM